MEERSGNGSVGTSPSIAFLCRETGPVRDFELEVEVEVEEPGISVKEKECSEVAFLSLLAGLPSTCFSSLLVGKGSALALIVSCSLSSLMSSLLRGREDCEVSSSRGFGG